MIWPRHDDGDTVMHRPITQVFVGHLTDLRRVWRITPGLS